MNQNFYHRIFASTVFVFAFLVYYLTVAPTTSFWDCGEFITCAYTLGVPHPPGAPFFLLIGRIFSMIPWAADIGLRVNIISALASSFTAMLTYLIIVKLISLVRGATKKFIDQLILHSSGVIAALAFAFSDSQWFNSVEAEVYAISMFFTAIIIWLILVWREKADDPASDKYLLLISYCIGLAIGVHLLNILALPAIFMIYYFRKHQFSFLSFLTFVMISTLIFIGIYPGIVKSIPNFALFLIENFGPISAAIFFIVATLSLIAALVFFVWRNNRFATTAMLCFLLILIGASTFTTIYLRSQLNPAIDENDPENMKNFVSYINREQYGDWSYIKRQAPLWEYQIKKMYLRYFGWQFIGKGITTDSDGLIKETISLNGLWGLPFLIGLIGLVYHFRKDRQQALAILLLFLMTGIAIVLYLNQPQPQPRERDYVYVGSFFAFALWIGLGIAAILESIAESILKKNSQPGILLTLTVLAILILVPLNMFAINFHNHDRSGNYIAYDYSYNLLQSCEKDALLFTNGDNDTFPLWFLQYVYHIRPDVRIINLSLLNTHWYIRQLLDEEPRVPIKLSDDNIDQLVPIYWPEKKLIKIEVPKEVYQQELNDLGHHRQLVSKAESAKPEISFELGPTIGGQGLRVQDIMILNIIAGTQFKKPIYFAITVSHDNMLNLSDYLRMDGLVFKLVTYPGDQISPSRLKTNLFETFKYRNLDNPNVYYDDNTIGLLTNYRSAFLRLASFYHQEKMYSDVQIILDEMAKKIPERVIPILDPRLSLGIGNLYLEAGKPDEFERRLNTLVNSPGTSTARKFEYAQVFYQYLNKGEKAEELVLQIINDEPDFLNGYYWLFSYYEATKNFSQGYNLAQRLLNLYPEDRQAKNHAEHFEKLLHVSNSTTN